MAKDFSITMDAQLAPAVRQFVKFAQQVQGTEGSLKKLTQAAGQAVRQIDSSGQSGVRAGAAMSGAFDRVKSSLVGLVGGGGALAALVANLREVVAASDEAARALRAQEDAIKSILQISKDTADFNQKMALSEQVGIREGIGLTRGAQIVFAADSAQLADQTNLFARFNRIGDPLAAINLTNKLEGSFGPEEAGTPEQILSKGLAAAARTEFNFNQLAPALSIAAAGAAGIGGTDEELFALTAGLAKATRSAEIAENLIRVANSEIKRAGFGGKGTLAGLERFERDQPEEFAARMLARDEFGDAVTLIKKNRPLIDDVYRDVNAANDLVPLMRAMELANGSDVLTAIRLRGMAAARREAAERGRGLSGLMSQAEIDNQVTASIMRGDPPAMTAALESQLNRTRTLFGASVEGDEGFIENRGDIFGGISGTFLRAMSIATSAYQANSTGTTRGDSGGLRSISEVMFQNTEELKQMRREARERDRLKSGVPSLRGPGQDRAEDTRTGQ